jgi:glycosyltransferase involved in cell wall biosynthesis
MKVVAVILTLNEEQHLPRCLASLEGVINHVLIVDCFSIDNTIQIAKEYGSRVVQHEWVNYATQFNWALDQLEEDTDWVLRIDADEYLTPKLAGQIKSRISTLDKDVDGILFNRRMKFLGKSINYGGVFPVKVLRLFRHGHGECEKRWMDEHIKVDGLTLVFEGELIDDNHNSLTWWTEKHNHYASREVIDLLNLKYEFMPHDTVANLANGSQAAFKRWVKENVYSHLPGGFRALIYFCYRYFLRLGFLDGKQGTAFHFLQGFWYRYLVDAKLDEVERYKEDHECDVLEAIKQVLEITIDH